MNLGGFPDAATMTSWALMLTAITGAVNLFLTTAVKRHQGEISKKIDGLLDARVSSAKAEGHAEGADAQRAATQSDTAQTATDAAAVLAKAAETAANLVKGRQTP